MLTRRTAGVPDLVPMVDLYERSGRPKPLPRLDFPGYVSDDKPPRLLDA